MVGRPLLLKSLLSENGELASLSVKPPIQYERLEMYAFGVDYPNHMILELNPKSTRDHGDVAFKAPGGFKVFVSWGELAKVQKLGGVDAHADYSIKRMKGSGEAKVIDVKRESTKVQGHVASYNVVKLELIRRGIFFNKTATAQEVRSLHLHCDTSSRYFVIYGPATPERVDEQRETIAKMVQTFSCHPAVAAEKV